MKKEVVILKIIFAVTFIVSLYIAIGFGLPLLQSMIPEMTDGIPAPDTLLQLIFGEEGWTRAGYFNMFAGAVRAAFVSVLAYAITSLAGAIKRSSAIREEA